MAHQGNLDSAIAYLRKMGDEPEVEGLSKERWIITKPGGSKETYYEQDEFNKNYHGCKGDSAVYISPVGIYEYYK